MSSTHECKRPNGNKKLRVQFEDPLVQEIPNHQKTVSLSASDCSLESIVTDGDIHNEDNEKNVSELYTSMLLPDGSCPSAVWSFQGGSVTQSSPIQTMSRPAGYDPNRIPVSIFSSKPTTEWSLASNESLFSIQLGNNSFSRDHVLMLNKCGDFKFEDLNTVQTTPVSVGEISNSDVKNSNKLENQHAGLAKTLELPTVDVGSHTEPDKASAENAGLSVNLKSHATETSVSTGCKSAERLAQGVGNQPKYGEISMLAVKYGMKKNPEEKAEVRRTSTVVSTCVSYWSESNTSTQSFYFPILAGGSDRTSSATVDLQPQLSQSFQSQEMSQQPLQTMESPPEQMQTQHVSEQHMQPQKMETENLQNAVNLPKLARTTWFSCLSCRSPCY